MPAGPRSGAGGQKLPARLGLGVPRPSRRASAESRSRAGGRQIARPAGVDKTLPRQPPVDKNCAPPVLHPPSPRQKLNPADQARPANGATKQASETSQANPTGPASQPSSQAHPTTNWTHSHHFGGRARGQKYSGGGRARGQKLPGAGQAQGIGAGLVQPKHFGSGPTFLKGALVRPGIC